MTRYNLSPGRTSPERGLGIRLARIAALVSVTLAFALAVNAQQLNEVPLVLKAKKCQVVVNVQWNRHDTNFPEKTEFSEIFAAVHGSGLRTRYTETTADHADLILKLDDDALLDRITLDVLNPDDNSVVYSESRDRVAVDNDVKRLIEHFLRAVDDALIVSPQLLGLYGSVGGCDGSIFLYDSAALTGTPVALVTPGTVLRVRPSSVDGSYSAQMEDFQTETVVHSGFIAEKCLSKTWQAPSLPAASGDRGEENPANVQDSFVSTTNDHTPSYLWVGRFDREDQAQNAAKKVQDLGLPVTVVPRHSSKGDLFVVVTGPYGSERVESAMDYLKTQGFLDVRIVKNPSASGDENSN